LQRAEFGRMPVYPATPATLDRDVTIRHTAGLNEFRWVTLTSYV